MTVSAQNCRNDYIGTGVLAEYDYNFKIFDEEDLLLSVSDLSGNEYDLVIGTDYTVDGVGDKNGGSITLVNNSQAWLTGGFLTSDFNFTIRRSPPLTQETDIRNQGDFYADVHEDEFDTLVMQLQSLQDQIDRCWKMAETMGPELFDPTIPASLKGQSGVVVMTDAIGGSLIPGPTASNIANAEAFGEAAEDSATAAALSAAAAAASASSGSGSAAAAAASAAAALASQTAAAASATAAAASATTATTQAAAASTSATNAATSATNAASSATTATTQATNAATSAATATTQATNAAASATAAAASATTASTQAANAAASAAAAAASATAAAASAAFAGQIYNAVVGAGAGCNYATLALALAAASAGWRILIKDSATINTGGAFTISLANIQIDFAPGVTYTKGTLVGALFTVAASGCRINAARFSGFDTAISVSATFNYNFFVGIRFATCTNEITEVDATPINQLGPNLTE